MVKQYLQSPGYIGSIFDSLVDGICEEKLGLYKEKIGNMIPAPMHSVFAKEDKDTAVKKFHARQKKTTPEVLPTAEPGRSLSFNLK